MCKTKLISLRPFKVCYVVNYWKQFPVLSYNKTYININCKNIHLAEKEQSLAVETAIKKDRKIPPVMVATNMQSC